MPENWQSIAARKQKERDSRIPKEWQLSISAYQDRKDVLGVPRECGLLTAEELRITEDFDATALTSGLSTGLLRSIDVTTAFCKRAAIAQQLVNCLTEIFFDDALARAKQLDEHLARTGKPMGPLHGLPVSLKDCFKVQGYDASVGVAGFCFRPARANSALVELLLSLGAVLYCKTNVPLTMMALDSHNNVFGRTLNPANRLLTAGGSSGGEGALVGLRGSVLGVGTDVGGSIRIPAACNNVYGVKPSHGRVPFAGIEGGALPGSSKLAIEATAGPIAVSVRDCEMFIRVVSDGMPSGLDPDVVSQPWKQQHALAKSQPLRVGIAYTDGHVAPLPPVHRLMEDVARMLSSSKRPIEVVTIDLSSLGPACLKTFNGFMSADGANTWFDHIEATGEPMSPWLATRLRRRRRKSLDDIRSLQAQKTDLQTRFLQVWREGGGHWFSPAAKTPPAAASHERTLDVILCPVAPHPIAPIDRWNTTNYTSMFNLLDLPGGVLPIRQFTEQDLRGAALPTTAPANGWEKINRELWKDVDQKTYLGSPMVVQVLTRRLEERKLVEAMMVLEEALEPLRGGVRKGGSKI